MLLILSPGKKRKPPEKKTQERLKEVAGQVAEVNRPPHSTMFDPGRLASILRPRNTRATGLRSERRPEAGCPPTASYCTTWFTTEDLLVAEAASPKY
jgi:hypothetical protein